MYIHVAFLKCHVALIYEIVNVDSLITFEYRVLFFNYSLYLQLKYMII